MTLSQKITTFLWFDNCAEEAVALYLSIFPGGKIVGQSPGPGGRALTVTFELFGQQYIALNGGPMFRFNEAVSLYVDCETQEEVDALWQKFISAGGTDGRCGWLKDKFGLSWQIIPRGLSEMLGSPDRAAAGRALQAMMGMSKIDLAAMRNAFDGN